MLTVKKKIRLFAVFCILALFPFLQGLLIRSSRRFGFATLFSFYFHDRVFIPLKNRLYNMNWKNDKQTDWELEHFGDSQIYKCQSQAEKYGLEDFCRMRVFSFSKNDMNSLFIRKKSSWKAKLAETRTYGVKVAAK